jgi:glutathione synthase/RimK-type ligase-like ATP-grasp enzyme
VATARNFRDKAQMKSVLRAGGIPCARHRLADSAAAAADFAREVGFPLVVKPPAGAGAKSTFRLDDADDLRVWLDAAPPTPDRLALLEEFQRRGRVLRQRDAGRSDRLGLAVGLPAHAAGGAAQPVDPVDGAAAP